MLNELAFGSHKYARYQLSTWGRGRKQSCYHSSEQSQDWPVLDYLPSMNQSVWQGEWGILIGQSKFTCSPWFSRHVCEPCAHCFRELSAGKKVCVSQKRGGAWGKAVLDRKNDKCLQLIQKPYLMSLNLLTGFVSLRGNTASTERELLLTMGTLWFFKITSVRN